MGRTVRDIARVTRVEDRSVWFEEEAWEGDRKIDDRTHHRGVVDVAEGENRFGLTRPAPLVRELSMQVAQIRRGHAVRRDAWSRARTTVSRLDAIRRCRAPIRHPSRQRSAQSGPERPCRTA
ncbi:hypothetical protein [Bradyrhizobium sp. 5.13L]